MKLFLKRFEKTYLFLIKALLIASLFVTFFGFYMQMLPQLEGINRTSVVSFVTFLLSIILFIRIYGGFSIGRTSCSKQHWRYKWYSGSRTR